MYYQYHECQGYKAKITVEWEVPDNDHLKENLRLADDIADDIICFCAPKTKDMVNKMRKT